MRRNARGICDEDVPIQGMIGFSLKGWEIVAGGRSVAKTTGSPEEFVAP